MNRLGFSLVVHAGVKGLNSLGTLRKKTGHYVGVAAGTYDVTARTQAKDPINATIVRCVHSVAKHRAGERLRRRSFCFVSRLERNALTNDRASFAVSDLAGNHSGGRQSEVDAFSNRPFGHCDVTRSVNVAAD